MDMYNFSICINKLAVNLQMTMKINSYYKIFISDTKKIDINKLLIFFAIYTILLILSNTKLLNQLVTFLYNLVNIDLFSHFRLSNIIFLIVFIIILPKYYLNYSITTSKNKGLPTIIGFGIFILALIGLDLLLFSPSNIKVLIDKKSTFDIIINVFILFLGGYIEEYIFRGILLKQLVKYTKKVFWSFVICSLLFSISHIPCYSIFSEDYSIMIFYLIYAFSVSYLLCDIYYISNNLIMVSILHSLLNINLLIFTESEKHNNFYIMIAIFIVMTAPLTLRMFYRIKKSTANSC